VYPALDETVAAILEGADELYFDNHRKPVALCRHAGKASCVQSADTFVCVLLL